jgi:hypothetical protein
VVRQKLARLERIAQKTGATRCGRCGGGVSGVPLMTICGEWDGNFCTTYNADRRGPRCGAVPPHVVNVVFAGDGGQ